MDVGSSGNPKKRNRNVLTDYTAYSKRYKNDSLIINRKDNRNLISLNEYIDRSVKKKVSEIFSISAVNDNRKKKLDEILTTPVAKRQKSIQYTQAVFEGKGMSAKRKGAIDYIFNCILFGQEKELWDDKETGAIKTIIETLKMPKDTNSKRCVRTALEDILNNNSKGKNSQRGRKVLIEEFSPEAQIVYEMAEHGIGSPQIAATLNERRKVRGVNETIGKDAVDGFVKRSIVLTKHRRLTEKTGKTDKESQWAKCRLGQCIQYLEQVANGLAYPIEDPPVDEFQFFPVRLNEIVFSDEKHKQCVLGCNSKYEVQVSRNEYKESCRGLDAYGFSDLEANISYSVAISSFLPHTHKDAMHLGTPAQVAATMTKCWQVEPTSERIVQDIMALPMVLQKIIDAEGTIVLNEGVRHSRRAMRHDGNGLLTTRLKPSQRKSTLRQRPLHPSLHFIRNAIINTDDGLINIEAAIAKAEEDAELAEQDAEEEEVERVRLENIQNNANEYIEENDLIEEEEEYFEDEDED